jgi:hypothetical protein
MANGNTGETYYSILAEEEALAFLLIPAVDVS